jgi:hypothetical protein
VAVVSKATPSDRRQERRRYMLFAAAVVLVGLILLAGWIYTRP